jgi:hypothetical protein
MSAYQRVERFIAEAAARFNIPIAWIKAVMSVESAHDPQATSPKGAMGLMQIMPKTYADLRAKHGLGGDPYNPRDNILAGTAYLREMHDRYGSPGFLAAYNAGPDRYENYLTRGHGLPAETRAYVSKVRAKLGVEQEERTQRVKLATTEETAWNKGPLFFVQEIIDQLVPKSPPMGNQSSSGLQIHRTSNVRSTADVTALVPQQQGIFVHRSVAARHP